MDFEIGDTFTGSEIAAKMRDGAIDTVEMLVYASTVNARGEKQGERLMRVQVPQKSLTGSFGGGQSKRYEITETYTFDENRVVVKPRA